MLETLNGLNGAILANKLCTLKEMEFMKPSLMHLLAGRYWDVARELEKIK